MSVQDGRLSIPQDDMIDALRGPWRGTLERDLLPPFLARQRWFGAKDQEAGPVSLLPLAPVGDDHVLCFADIALRGGDQRYFLPLALQTGPRGAAVIASVDEDRALVDGAAVPKVAQAFLDAMRAGSAVQAGQGELRFEGTELLRETPSGPPRPLDAEQSNVSVLFGEEIILKIYRRLRPGVQPDVEMARYLTQEGGFKQTPAYLGSAALHEEGEVTTFAAAFAFVPNQGDAWTCLTGLLARALREGRPVQDTGADLIRRLGQRTGDMHCALARPCADPVIQPEPMTSADLAAWVAETQGDLASALDMLAGSRLDARAERLAQRILAAREDLARRIARVATLPPSGPRTRIHGDYHLGQVLVSNEDVTIIDFEGEPRRSLEARRLRTAPLRDVAGMLRSLDYAARSVLEEQADPESARSLTEGWHAGAAQRYLSAYGTAMEKAASQPAPQLRHALLDLFLIQKAAYEIGYELANRPAWAHLPLAGLVALIESETPHG